MHERGIPDLFQQLMIALMMTTPDDHLAFLISCLAQLKHVQTFESNGSEGETVRSRVPELNT